MVMAIKEDALAECGLTSNESRLYLALLESGTATAVEISRKSKIHRVNVYDLLERLMGKGLISCVVRGYKKIYRVSDPEQLMRLVEKKREILGEAMPGLKAGFKARKSKEQVYNFFGPEGVMRAYFMMLDQKEMIYGIGGSGLNRRFLKHRHELWNKERLRRKIRMKVLYYEFTRREKDVGWQDSTVSVRFLPDKYKTMGMIDVCGSLVVNLLPVEGDIMAIVIENKVLADTYRQLFRFMWKYSNK
jgi:HTH-type transcriptional regulator, sugar sensing transcriptional regulator